MSRAFVFEKDDMFHCSEKDKDCQYANLRGDCELVRCKDDDVSAIPEPVELKKEDTLRL